MKQQFLHYFCKIQKIYRLFNKLIFIHKYNKALLTIKQDLNYNDLEISNNVLCILHNNYKYLFSIYDLIKLIETSLTNTDRFICKPLHIKNPYNNLPFNKSILFTIYVFIRINTHIYSNFFFKYCLVDFNLKKFKIEYECQLCKNAIVRYINYSPTNIIIQDILHMIKCYNNGLDENTDTLILIHPTFPQEYLLKAMKPYLIVNFKALYSVSPSAKHLYKYIFFNKMDLFCELNPLFGRINIKLYSYGNNFKRKFYKKISYNTNYIILNNINNFDKELYLNDNLS
jgi:hypothetical protein